MNNTNHRRRRFLATAGGLAAASALGPLAGRAQAAGACTGRVVVGTWGGDYQRLLQENINPLVEPAGVTVVYDVGSALVRQTKMRSEAHARRSTLDIALLRDNDMFQMQAEGTTVPLDEAHIPNLAHVIPQFRRGYAIPHIFSALVLVYDTSRVKTRPDGLAVLLDPAYKGKVGLVDDQYDYLTLAGALATGKPVGDLEAGQAFLRQLRENKPHVYPSVDALAAALKSGEIDVTVTWKARTLQWKKAGLPVDYVFPKEGALPATFEAGIAVGSKAQDCAFPYLNAMLDPRAQRAFAETMGYAPTVSNAALPPELQQAVGFSGAELERIVPVDFALVMKHKGQMLDFWNRDFRNGL
ncbi:ABC transporter substrate-binding protein [Bordetella sp. H567]|uniref:ABC transporter substrate-binding protein n=1 Tax=Bordetella sp. H567 TaxID=1697043 RepID=UPI00081CE84F|nr:extracellular solute-binding protein [Bordetella sp. H567]AOB31537.1 ABC transporter substrate-binding protein [Bordetella sp. H567]